MLGNSFTISIYAFVTFHDLQSRIGLLLRTTVMLFVLTRAHHVNANIYGPGIIAPAPCARDTSSKNTSDQY